MEDAYLEETERMHMNVRRTPKGHRATFEVFPRVHLGFTAKTLIGSEREAGADVHERAALAFAGEIGRYLATRGIEVGEYRVVESEGNDNAGFTVVVER